MSDIELHLFRIKFIRPIQTSMLHDQKSASEIFKEAISAKPSSEFRQDYIWHIGNIKKIDDYGGSLAVGRTTKTTVSKYDIESGNFVEEYFEQSPYTICLYDLRIGFLAIAKKSKLAPTSAGIASKLKKLLDTTQVVRLNELDVRIDPISDPTGFIQKLSSAYALKRFTAHFTGPNPTDADELFQKPISIYCQAVNGVSGKVVTDGDALNNEVVVEVTKSVAATANEASARIVERQGQRAKNIHLRGDPAKKTFAEERFSEEIALNDMRNEYRRIRG
jgi:hypothetical protein